MAEELAEDLALRDDGDAPQRPALAKRTGDHLQGKHTLQEPRPAPVRRHRAGLLFLHTLLARRRENCLAQCAIGRQTPTIAHEVDAMWRKHAVRTALPLQPLYVVRAAVAK
jgi:hypothetical protein